MKLDKTWNYVKRSDDMRYKALWDADPELSKIYELFVVQAYSVSQVAKMIGSTEIRVYLLIEGARRHYEIGLIERIKRFLRAEG